MKTVLDYIQSLQEEGMSTNTMGSGQIATVTPPIGTKLAKRKELKEVTDENASAEEKDKFKKKQQFSNDQVMSYD